LDLKIKDKIALVTAASKGLGKAVAIQLAKEGSRVIICSRDKATLVKAEKEIIAETNGFVKSYVCDVTKPEQVQKLINSIIEEFGNLHILVCNAGGPPAGNPDNFSLEDYQNAFELNLLSTINLCNSVIPIMKKQNWGRIVNITSIAAKQPIDSLILSNTARSGVLGFSKTLSNHVAKFGITVNSVCPGYTKTGRVENLAKSFEESGKGTKAEFYQSIEKQIPMNRIGTTEEFAQTVTFLASEGAGYITGVSLQIDGGFNKGII